MTQPNLREDPVNFTNFNRTDAELELAWLFCLSVAGKTARVVASQLEMFLLLEPGNSPFDRIRSMITTGTLVSNMKVAKLGKYNLLEKGYTQSLGLNLRTATREDLMKISGVGYKTASYFILHTRPNQNIATLDRHVVKHLGTLGYTVPKGAPSGNEYLELEKAFLAEAKKVGKTPAEWDLELWNQYSRKVNGV